MDFGIAALVNERLNNNDYSALLQRLSRCLTLPRLEARGFLAQYL